MSVLPRVIKAGLCFAFLLTTAGCANHFVVHKIGTDGTAETADVGFRYSIPVPYLIITNTKLTVPGAPAGDTTTKPPSTTAKPAAGAGSIDLADDSSKPGPPQVTATIVYLPSNERYAVKVKSGAFGTFKGSFTLQNGWMLTAMNQEYDTKGTETLTAVAGLLGTALKGPVGFAPTGNKADGSFLCIYRMNFNTDPNDSTKETLSLQVVTSNSARQTCQSFLGK